MKSEDRNPKSEHNEYQRGANVVVLEPDVAKFFPNAEAVNDSLRALAHIIRRQGKVIGGKS